MPVIAMGLALAVMGVEAGAAEHVIPSDRCRGLWLVTVDYRDGSDGGLLMVLDTGAGKTAVDPDSLERVFGQRIRAGKRVTLKDGTVGPLTVRRLKVTVHDMDHLSRALGRKIDGILGFPTFKNVLLTLDYHADEVRVGSGRLPPPDRVTVFSDVGKTRPYLAIEIGGATVPVLIDSGSASGFRFDPDDALDWRVDPRTLSASTGYDTIRLDRTGRLAADITVGPLVARSPIARVWNGTRLMGVEVIHRFAWTFDQRTDRIRLLPDSPDPIVTGPERGIGVAFKPVPAGFEIARIFDGTPAAATDLTVGDIVIAIDGVPLDERDCNAQLAPEDRNQVVLTVRRGGTDRDIAIEIATLIP